MSASARLALLVLAIAACGVAAVLLVPGLFAPGGPDTGRLGLVAGLLIAAALLAGVARRDRAGR